MTEQGGQIPTQQPPPPQWGQTPSQPPTPPPPQWGPVPPSQPRKRRNTGVVIIVIVAGLLAILAIAMATSDPAAPSGKPAATDSGISKGLGTKDASGDVKLLSFRHRGYSEYQGTIEIINHSDGTSDYYIELVILDQDGTNIDWTNAVAEHVRPGQRALVSFSTFEKLAHKAVVTEIQRTSSN